MGGAVKDLLSKLSKKAKIAAADAAKALSEATDSARETSKTFLHETLDQDGDGKFDRADFDRLKEKGLEIGKTAINKTGEILKEASKSKLAKDVAASAAIGAGVGIPLPIVGPAAGAAVGAGIGVIKNIKETGAPTYSSQPTQNTSKDFHEEMLKLVDLKEKGAITEEEFEELKKKLLKKEISD
jgi:Ca2+-binding EF-hand superfamily protein